MRGAEQRENNKIEKSLKKNTSENISAVCNTHTMFKANSCCEYVEKDNLWNDLKYRCTTWSNLVVLSFFVCELRIWVWICVCVCVYTHTLLILLFASLFNVNTQTHTDSRFLYAFMRCFIYNHTITCTRHLCVLPLFCFDSVCDEAKLLCPLLFTAMIFQPEKILLQLMTIPNNQMVEERVYCVDYHANLQAFHNEKKCRWHLLWWTQTTKIKVFHSKNVYSFKVVYALSRKALRANVNKS